MLLHDGLDVPQGLEGSVLEVAVAVHLALAGVGGRVAARVGDFGGLVLAGEDTTCELCDRLVGDSGVLFGRGYLPGCR